MRASSRQRSSSTQLQPTFADPRSHLVAYRGLIRFGQCRSTRLPLGWASAVVNSHRCTRVRASFSHFAVPTSLLPASRFPPPASLLFFSLLYLLPLFPRLFPFLHPALHDAPIALVIEWRMHHDYMPSLVWWSRRCSHPTRTCIFASICSNCPGINIMPVD